MACLLLCMLILYVFWSWTQFWCPDMGIVVVNMASTPKSRFEKIFMLCVCVCVCSCSKFTSLNIYSNMFSI